MSLISDIIDYGKSLLFINETLKTIQEGDVERDATIVALAEKFADLDKRVVKLETARDADLARIEAALAQVTAERKSMAADFERYMSRIQNAPQLPPETTDN